MEILIMGGTQFVSKSLAKYMIKKNHQVDIFTRGKIPVDYEGVRNHLIGDRSSKSDLKNILSQRKYEVIFDISAYTKDDVTNLTTIIDQTKLKNYIFCSSGAVYKPSEELINETFPKGPNFNWGDYGENKLEAENYLLSLNKNYNFPVIIFRPTYIYGEGNNLYRELYLFDRIQCSDIIPIPWGEKKNQFIHIDDLLTTFESSLYSDVAIGQTYNLTHPEEVTWKNLVETTMDVMGKSIKVKEIDYNELDISVREFFPFRDVMYRLSIEKLKNDGLHVPSIGLKEGLSKVFVNSYNPNHHISDKGMNKVELVLQKMSPN